MWIEDDVAVAGTFYGKIFVVDASGDELPFPTVGNYDFRVEDPFPG